MPDHAFRARLKLLEELALEFALANPGLAPLLDGKKTDPDVERLLETVAFQNAMLHRKLDQDFPDLVHSLTQLTLPHYLRPIPAATIIGFSSNTASGQTVTIPAGTRFDSMPVNGTTCRFETSSDLEIQPLELTDASLYPQSGRGAEIRLSLRLQGLPLSRWRPQTVRLFLSDESAFAIEIYLLLCRHVTGIVLTPTQRGAAVTLPADCLTPAGFAEKEKLFPYPAHAFPGYRLLQEYFAAPAKFLFFDLGGWEKWQERGDGMQFTISLQLDRLPSNLPRVKRESFALHAVPAVNLFRHDADPISADHRAGLYPIRPAGSKRAHLQIFSVDRVTGYSRANGTERNYLPHELFKNSSVNEPVYHLLPAHPRLQDGHELDLCLTFPEAAPFPDKETLSIELTCSNGSLPESLCPGDIAKPLAALPDFVSARNISAIHAGHSPELGSGLLWQLTTHLYLNHLSLATVEHLRTLLELYVCCDRSGPHSAANLKRISGIEALEATAGEIMVAGVAMRGREIRLMVRQDHFTGPGDLYLFGCLLDHFLACYASMNGYTRLSLQETSKGGSYQWPARMGAQIIESR